MMHLDCVPLNKCCSYDIFKIVFSIPANVSECHIFQLSVNVLIYCLLSWMCCLSALL